MWWMLFALSAEDLRVGHGKLSRRGWFPDDDADKAPQRESHPGYARQVSVITGDGRDWNGRDWDGRDWDGVIAG